MIRKPALRPALARLVSSLAAIAAVCVIFAVKAAEQGERAPTQIAEAAPAR